jgi:acetyl esterase/lipase
MEIQTYQGRASLPYAIEERPGAQHLLVSFPGLRSDERRGEPSLRTGELLPTIHAHRLHIGADEHLFLGPRRTFAGSITAAELIHREGERLGVPLERVMTLGTSMGGLCALAVGMRAKVGRMVAGAPAIRIATDFASFVRGEDEMQSASTLRRYAMRLASSDEGPPAEAWLDQMLFDRAADITHPTAIHLFVAPRDATYESVRLFAAALEAKPMVDCEMREFDYGTHPRIGRYFMRYALEVATRAGMVAPDGDTAGA